MEDNTTTQPSCKTTDSLWSNIAGVYPIHGRDPKSISVDHVGPGTGEEIARYQQLENHKDQLEQDLIVTAEEQHEIELRLAKSDRQSSRE